MLYMKNKGYIFCNSDNRSKHDLVQEMQDEWKQDYLTFVSNVDLHKNVKIQ